MSLSLEHLSTVPESEQFSLSNCITSTDFAYTLGVWKRVGLEEPINGVNIEFANVYWMQTNGYFCDIRVPLDRPSFFGVKSLQECSEQQLRWMCKMKSFAGKMKVEEKNGLVTCVWDRFVDFQPPLAAPDVGYVFYAKENQGKMIEYGTDWDYKEYWEKVDDKNLISEKTPTTSSYATADGKGFFTFSDDQCLMVFDARVDAVPTFKASLAELNGTLGEMQNWVNFISFYGVIEGSNILIKVSTFPWLEDKSVSFLIKDDILTVTIEDLNIVFLNKYIKTSSLPVILGSSSLYRQKLMSSLNISFSCMNPDINEKEIALTSNRKLEDTRKLTLAIATAKAVELLKKLRSSSILITCDQIAVYQGENREKPESDNQAYEWWMQYSNSYVSGVTSVVVYNTETNQRFYGSIKAKQSYTSIPKHIIDSLVKDREIFTCCGGFIVSNDIIAPYLSTHSGSFDELMGFPIKLVEKLLKLAN